MSKFGIDPKDSTAIDCDALELILNQSRWVTIRCPDRIVSALHSGKIVYKTIIEDLRSNCSVSPRRSIFRWPEVERSLLETSHRSGC